MARTPRILFLLATSAALSSLVLTAPARADVRSGVAAWEVGNFEAAVREWRPLAVAGDADAQFNLGQAYKLGRGVTQDLAQAADWFGRAAAQNHLQAQDNLGLVLYDMGNKADALPWLQQSAMRGEPRAQFVMGAELFNGQRISRDWPRAYAFMKRATDAGLQRAAAALVQMDAAISLDQRQQGLQLAAAMEASEPQARLAAMSASAPPRPSSPPTIRTAELPPSVPGTSYTPPPLSEATEPLPSPVPSRVAEAATAVRPDQRLGSPPAPVVVAAAPGQTIDPRTVSASRATVAVASAPSVGTASTDDGLRPGLSASIGGAETVAENRGPVRTAGATPPPSPAIRAPIALPDPAAATANATGGSWRIQLGAFGNRRGAEQRWARVAARLAGATPSYTAVGSLTRLQAGGYPNRAAATQACAAVRAESPDCFAVSG
jgi:uncharacterized protein